MTEKDALDHIIDLNISVMLPHMYCNEGMTRYRGLFEKLNIPFLGNKESTINISMDKGLTKDILAKAKISVPKAELLIKGFNETPEDYSFPCIVKSCTEDNTLGVKYVKTEEEMTLALEHCFNLGPRVLIEQYIKGKEMRAGVIEQMDGSLTVLPKVEYYITGEIRTLEDKLLLDENGNLTKNAQANAIKRDDRQCPAYISDILDKRINQLVINAHKALNCRHYSLFDIRVDENQIPYILESCLFCSFAPTSVIVSLADKLEREELSHPNLFHSFLEREIEIKKGH